LWAYSNIYSEFYKLPAFTFWFDLINKYIPYRNMLLISLIKCNLSQQWRRTFFLKVRPPFDIRTKSLKFYPQTFIAKCSKNIKAKLQCKNANFFSRHLIILFSFISRSVLEAIKVYWVQTWEILAKMTEE
jgi:hypothetical protein